MSRECTAITELIKRESRMGTRQASASAVWGDNTIPSLVGLDIAYQGKPLDLDWYVHVRSKMQDGVIPPQLDAYIVYTGGKTFWGVVKAIASPFYDDIKLSTTTIPYVSEGEREAVKLLGKGGRYSEIFKGRCE